MSTQPSVVHRGNHGDYFWLVSDSEIRELQELIVRFHPGQRLCVIAFDSGRVRPVEEELEAGWLVQGGLMVSPLLNLGVDIPSNGYDEWCIRHVPPIEEREYEVFVNYGGFTLVSPEEIYSTFDPTWDRCGMDFLIPIQERFWAQIDRDRPESYIASGDKDVVVSRNLTFIDAVSAAIAQSTQAAE